jgi:hypothetical protein
VAGLREIGIAAEGDAAEPGMLAERARLIESLGRPLRRRAIAAAVG